MLEPGNNNIEIGRGIKVAKKLSIVNERVPFRIININIYSVKLKKVIAVGDFVGVSLVQHLVFEYEPLGKVLKTVASEVAEESQGR